jgi:hypothetical protein
VNQPVAFARISCSRLGLSVLTTQLAKLLTRSTASRIIALASVGVRLGDPATDRLRRALELLSELVGIATGAK